MKITVLGGSGFLGSHLCDLLSLKGYKVNIFDIKKTKYIKKNQKMYQGNILDKNKLSKAVKGSDFVYHFAALADMDFARTKALDTAKDNILATINVLNICKKHKVKRLIFASSIYANTEEGGFYGLSKQAAERYIEEFHKVFGTNYTILRFGSLYGSRAGKSNGINVIINSGIKKKKLFYSGSKRAARKYIHVKDAVDACIQILKKKYKNKYLTITGRRLIKVKSLMKILAKHLKIRNKKIIFLNNKNVGHYDVKPTPFKPRIGKNLKLNKEKDFNKNLIDLIS